MNGIVVLISGRGSNLEAMCNSGLAKEIKCVISNKASAPGLDIAKKYGINTTVIDHKLYNSREEFDSSLSATIDNYQPEVLVLAGFMRILTSKFVSHYSGRMINIHPSLLPAFTGANAQQQAVLAKVKVSGATVHYVTQQLDHGPIIVQGIVGLNSNDDTATLSQRILALEHVIYPFAIKKILAHQVKVINSEYAVVEKNNTDNELLGQYQQYIYY